MFLRNSTSQVIRFGPFVDSTDGVTAETALTIAQADMQLSKGGGAFAQKNATGNATHDTDGWYSTTLNATDTATNGELILQVAVSGALPVWVRYYVVPASTYDALTTNGLNNVAATDIVSAGAITTSSGAVSNVTTVSTCTTNTDMRGTDNALLASSAPTNFGDLAITATTGQVTVGTNNDKTGYSISGIKTTLDSLNDIAATDIVSNGAITTLAGAVVNVDTVDTCTTNTDMRGTDGANTVAPDNTSITAILADTNELQTNQGNWVTATGFATSAQVSALNDISVNDILTTQMTESYAADGTAPTLAQSLFNIQQNLGEFSISGTTITVKQLDGTTTAMTYTLDDATSPTSKTRAT